MATFAKTTFSAASYATFRPSYPSKAFNIVLSYHQGPKSLALDLGCGHGVVAREMSPHFKRVLGNDPSEVMITQAKSITPASSFPNVTFTVSSAEDLSKIEDGNLDLVIAGQAAHWFDFGKVWPQVTRKLRRGGTVAFMGYKDSYFVDYPKATELLLHYCYDDKTMGPFWEQPGRNILRDLYKDIVPPETEYEDVQRVVYEPSTEGPNKGKGDKLMFRRLKLGEVEGYARTLSSYRNWMDAHPEARAKSEGGKGDIVDEMFEKMLQAEPDWRAKGEQWRDFEVENEWASVILLARKK